MLVLYDPLIYAFVLRAMPGLSLPQPNYFIPIIGQNAIITGIGLALLGSAGSALRMLVRIAAGRPLITGPGGAAIVDQMKYNCARSLHGKSQVRGTGAPGREIVTRGALNGRGYALFRDGSVVVETLLGPKRFGSMTDAQEFIVAD